MGGNFDENQAFGGKLTELNWLKVKLTSAQVIAIYKAGTGSPLPSSTPKDRTEYILKWADILNYPLEGGVVKEEHDDDLLVGEYVLATTRIDISIGVNAFLGIQSGA